LHRDEAPERTRETQPTARRQKFKKRSETAAAPNAAACAGRVVGNPMSQLDEAVSRAGAPSWRLPISYEKAGYALGVAEFLVILATGVLSYQGYHLVKGDYPGFMRDGLAVGSLVAVLYCAVLSSQGFYGLARLLNGRLSGFNLLLIWTGAFAVAAVVAFGLKAGAQFSRGAILSFLLTGFPAVLLCRTLAIRGIEVLVSAGALSGPRVAVLFEPTEAEQGGIFQELARHGYQVMRSFPLIGETGHAEATRALIAYVRQAPVEQVIVAASWSRPAAIVQILDRLQRTPVPVRLLADRHVRPLVGRTVSHIGSTIAIELRRAPLTRFEQIVKRCLDVVIGSAALVALAPLMAVIALLIRLDSPGPVFFRQKRVGFNGRPFMIFKFRTMSVLEDGAVIRQAVVGDPRVTRVGRFLRRTSIDELPQLFNVLGGEMSLVGPRPHAEAHDSAFDAAVADYALRHNVKPGITGWAQVNGSRGETPDADSVRRRVEHDVWYIDNWCLLIELKILIRTVRVLFGQSNAY
jgi:Undecaprenyl-phosphate glucose phosphotransferase